MNVAASFSAIHPAWALFVRNVPTFFTGTSPAPMRSQMAVARNAIGTAPCRLIAPRLKRSQLREKLVPIQSPQPTLTIRPFSIMITPLQSSSAASGERS